jgi:DNA repair protein RadC
MRITKYQVQIDPITNLNILVKESATNYSQYSDFKTTSKCIEMLNDVYHLNKMAEEYLYMIAFNTAFKVLGIFEISHGTVNSAIVNPREVFIRALLCGATYIMIAHNHPSSNITPSKQDIDVTNRIYDAGSLINVPLIDSLIIGLNGYSSLREMGYISY